MVLSVRRVLLAPGMEGSDTAIHRLLVGKVCRGAIVAGAVGSQHGRGRWTPTGRRRGLPIETAFEGLMGGRTRPS